MNEPRTAPVYIVMRHLWSYDDSTYDGENRPLVAFRDRAAAERERDRLTAEAKADIRRAERESNHSEFEESSWKFVVAELLLSAEADGEPNQPSPEG